MKKIFLFILLGALLNAEAQLPKLRISANKRFFTTADGKPFSGWAIQDGYYS
jgi:hypothetical protein